MHRTGFAKLPLHYGKAPRYLIVRMRKLAKEIVTIIIEEYGSDDFLRRISDPFWFQALGCVLGYDWHSSGVTTVLTGSLKQAIIPEELGVAVCGGKGRVSKLTPEEIQATGEKFGFSGDNVESLRYASKMSAKVDNAAVQAGYQLSNKAETTGNTPFLNYLIHLEKIGTRKAQLRNINWCLTHLNKNAPLNNIKAVEEFIAYHKGSQCYKAHLTEVYYKYRKFQNPDDPYKPTKYNHDATKPFKIPTEEKIKMIIADSGKTLATKLILSYKTGLRPVEVHDLKVKDIDLNQKLVYPTTAKHGAPRTLKIDNETASLILAHIIRNKLNTNDQLFKGQPSSYNTSFTKVRNRLAKKLNDPSFNTIRLYDLRHYFATMLYHKTKDILIVKQQLGHKDINNTLIYIDMEAHLYNLEEGWTCKVAQDTNDEIKLNEVGFEYVRTLTDGKPLYRKRK